MGVIGVLNGIREILGMDANYFYPALVTVLVAIISLIKCMVVSIYNRKKDNLLELYKTQETNYFYVAMMMIEILLFGIGCILISVILVLLLCVISCLKINILQVYLQLIFQILLFTLSFIIDLGFIKKILLRNISVKKRIIGRKNERWLLYSPIIIYNAWLVLICYFSKCTIAKVLILLLLSICEVWGLRCFKGTYIRYKYTSLTMFLKDGSIVKCEDISKIKRKKETVIIEKEHSAIHVRYDEVSRIEYCGEELIQYL